MKNEKQQQVENLIPLLSESQFQPVLESHFSTSLTMRNTTSRTTTATTTSMISTDSNPEFLEEGEEKNQGNSTMTDRSYADGDGDLDLG